jgi:F0F1-type ATP synthase membrane subunit c/vacuolar-type H+-ATPase subunit K
MATARIVWIALLVAVGMYVLVLAALLGPHATLPVAGDVATLRRVLMLLTVGPVAALLWLRRRLPLAAYGTERPTPDAQSVMTTYVVCWALSEAIALLGLVLGLLAQTIGEAYGFFIVGAALLVWQRPSAEHLAVRP